MRYLLFVLHLLTSYLTYSASPPTDSVLIILDDELNRASSYEAEKLGRITDLHARLADTSEDDLTTRYSIYAELYEVYKSYHYDSAFYCTRQLQQIAYSLADSALISDTKLKQGFIFLSAGMFKESFDTLASVSVAGLPFQDQSAYYALMARAYYDVADFNKDDYYTPLYTTKANAYVDSVLAVSRQSSYRFLYFRGLRSARMANIREGVADLEQLMNRADVSLHQSAVVASTLSDLYLRTAATDQAVRLLADAIRYDIKSSTKETAAILNLATILYQQGDVKRAYRYTKQALEDANFYGARHRKIQVGTILPIIEEEKLSIVESQRKSLLIYSVAVTVLSAFVVAFIVISLRQLRKLRLAKRAIDQANRILQDTNRQLRENNDQLNEANRIKEEYIGYYFTINSEYLNKIEKFKKAVSKSIKEQNMGQIQYIVSSIDLNKERKELFLSFDKVFLKLFPSFTEAFNAFFREEDRIKPPDHQLLNTDLRIFALIRLGIHDNDKIAKILNYSVNTIYAYKTRVKNRATVPNDEFERRMMAIELL